MKDYNIFWTDKALNDIIMIKDYISNDSVLIAEKQFRKIINITNQLKTFPYLERVLNTFQDKYRRELFIPPFKIYYKIEEQNSRVLIIRVIHMSRK